MCFKNSSFESFHHWKLFKKMWHIYIYNWILFSHKKEWNNAICSNIDKPLDYHIKWSETVSQFSCSVMSNSATLWTAASQASLSITNSQTLLKFMSIESMMPSNHLILCHPLLLPSIFPSIKVFSNESVLRIRWLKYCSFSVSVSLSNEYSGLISFRMDWLDLLAVQGTLKSLQHNSSKASVLWYSAFLMDFLVYLYKKYQVAQ